MGDPHGHAVSVTHANTPNKGGRNWLQTWILFRRMTNQPLLVSAAQDATIRFWDAATGDQKFVLAHKDSQVNCMAISPDSSQLAAAT